MLPEAVAVQINLLYFRKSVSFLLSEASIHYKSEMLHLCCALPSAYRPDTVSEIPAYLSVKHPSDIHPMPKMAHPKGSLPVLQSSFGPVPLAAAVHRKAVPDNGSPTHQAGIASDSHVPFLLFAIFLHDSRRKYCL